MLRVNEMFCSIQGEGLYSGFPSIFVRTVGCNLRCVFKDSICDTPYTSFSPENTHYNDWDDLMSDFENLKKSNPTVNHLVITGGEPLLQAEAVKEFIERVYQLRDDWVITIETNGTMEAIMPWEGEDGYVYAVDMWSISPKLSTSVDHNCKFLTEEKRDDHDKKRINIDNLNSYGISANYAHSEDLACMIQLKFVYSGEESVNEIEEILNKLTYDTVGIAYAIMLMPEGTTNDQLNNIQQECVKVCIEKGWIFTDRLHIRIWGDKRGV